MTTLAVLAARAYVQKRFRQFLADSANLKRIITVEAMAAHGLISAHEIARDFRKAVLEKEGDRE